MRVFIKDLVAMTQVMRHHCKQSVYLSFDIYQDHTDNFRTQCVDITNNRELILRKYKLWGDFADDAREKLFREIFEEVASILGASITLNYSENYSVCKILPSGLKVYSKIKSNIPSLEQIQDNFYSEEDRQWI